MKILLLSDLHVEFAPFVPDPAAVDAADVIVLAGDINYRIGDSKRSVRVICNPRGYPLGWHKSEFENPRFDPALLIDTSTPGRVMP